MEGITGAGLKMLNCHGQCLGIGCVVPPSETSRWDAGCKPSEIATRSHTCLWRSCRPGQEQLRMVAFNLLRVSGKSMCCGSVSVADVVVE